MEQLLDAQALRTIVDSYRTLADRLEGLIDGPAMEAHLPAAPLDVRGSRGEGIFDPETDRPDANPNPKGNNQAEIDWCGVVLFGQLRAIEMRRGRGATEAERFDIAKAAGYQDNRAWSGWPNTWQDDELGRRTLTEDGLNFLRHYYKQIARDAPADLKL